MNLRPPGYEPDELPACSTPRCNAHFFGRFAIIHNAIRKCKYFFNNILFLTTSNELLTEKATRGYMIGQDYFLSLCFILFRKRLSLAFSIFKYMFLINGKTLNKVKPTENRELGETLFLPFSSPLTIFFATTPGL